MADVTTQQAVTRLLVDWREGIDRAPMHGIPRSRRDDATPGTHFNQAHVIMINHLPQRAPPPVPPKSVDPRGSGFMR
jgi:hypothetical protein